MIHSIHSFLTRLIIITLTTYPLLSLTSAARYPESDISSGLWKELGRGIGDENLNDLAGYSVASDAEGVIIAVGSPYHESIKGPHTGRVRVYEYNEFTNSWRKVGDDIEGEDAGDEAGASVALSVSGDYLAVGSPKCSRVEGAFLKKEKGCVRVYELRTHSISGVRGYEQLGGTIVGSDAFDHFGASLALHAIYSEREETDDYNQRQHENGETDDVNGVGMNDDFEEIETVQVAIGAPGAKNENGEEVGMAYFIEYTIGSDGGWKDASEDFSGDDFVGEGKPGSRFGSSVALSIDNNLMVVGAPKDNGEGHENAGRVFLYLRKYDVNGQRKWELSPMSGTSVTWGQSEGELCGTSVAMDLRGDYIIYGCPGASSDISLKCGKAEVKRLELMTQTNEFIARQVGRTLYGEYSGDSFGTSVDIGQDEEFGNVFVAVGAPNNAPDTQSLNAGHVGVFHLIKESINDDFDETEEWLRANLDIDGKKAFDNFGTSVAISFDGHRVIGGAPGGAGYARIYDLQYTEPPTEAPTLYPTKPPTRNSGPTNNVGGQGGGSVVRSAPAWLTILYLLLVGLGIYAVVKGFFYWRGRRAYKSGFGEDNEVITHVNDLELSPNVSGVSPIVNGATQAETRDII